LIYSNGYQGCSSTCKIERGWVCDSENITGADGTKSTSNCTFVGYEDAVTHKGETTTILATIFPILAVLIGGFALAVWLVWRKNFALKKLKKPNFQEIAFGKDFTEEAPQLNPEQKAALEAVEEVSCDTLQWIFYCRFNRL
jgi:hypothetical protein